MPYALPQRAHARPMRETLRKASEQGMPSSWSRMAFWRETAERREKRSAKKRRSFSGEVRVEALKRPMRKAPMEDARAIHEVVVKAVEGRREGENWKEGEWGGWSLVFLRGVSVGGCQVEEDWGRGAMATEARGGGVLRELVSSMGVLSMGSVMGLVVGGVFFGIKVNLL